MSTTETKRSWTHCRVERRNPRYCHVTFDHPPINTITAGRALFKRLSFELWDKKQSGDDVQQVNGSEEADCSLERVLHGYGSNGDRPERTNSARNVPQNVLRCSTGHRRICFGHKRENGTVRSVHE